MEEICTREQQQYCDRLRQEFIREIHHLEDVIAKRAKARPDFIDKSLRVFSRVLALVPKASKALELADSVICEGAAMLSSQVDTASSLNEWRKRSNRNVSGDLRQLY